MSSNPGNNLMGGVGIMTFTFPNQQQQPKNIFSSQKIKTTEKRIIEEDIKNRHFSYKRSNFRIYSRWDNRDWIQMALDKLASIPFVPFPHDCPLFKGGRKKLHLVGLNLPAFTASKLADTTASDWYTCYSQCRSSKSKRLPVSPTHVVASNSANVLRQLTTRGTHVTCPSSPTRGVPLTCLTPTRPLLSIAHSTYPV